MIRDDDLVTVIMLRSLKAELVEQQQEMLYDIVCLAVDAEELFTITKSKINSDNRISGIDGIMFQNLVDYLDIPNSVLYKGLP